MLWVNTNSEVEGGGAEVEHGSDAGGGNKSGLGGGRNKRKIERGRRGARCRWRCKTRRMRASAGQEEEWPVRA
jgi:hypothetical protein